MWHCEFGFRNATMHLHTHPAPSLLAHATTHHHACNHGNNHKSRSSHYPKQQCNQYDAACDAAVVVLEVVVGCNMNSIEQSQRQCPGVKSALPALLSPPATLGSFPSPLWITQEPTCTTSNDSHRTATGVGPGHPVLQRPALRVWGLGPSPKHRDPCAPRMDRPQLPTCTPVNAHV